jgi:hypothetical protein
MQSVSFFASTCFSLPERYMQDDAIHIAEPECEKPSCFLTAQNLPCNSPAASLPAHHGWRENNQFKFVDGFVETSASSLLGYPSHHIHQPRDPDNPRRPNQTGIASTFQKLTMQKPVELNESIHYYPEVEANNFASDFAMNGLQSVDSVDRCELSHLDPSEFRMYCRTESAPSCLDYARAQINLELNQDYPHPDPTFFSGEVMRTCSAPLPYTARTHASKRQSSIDDYLALERPRQRSIREFISVLSEDPPAGFHPRPQLPHPSLTAQPMTGQLPTVCKVTAWHSDQSSAIRAQFPRSPPLIP